MDRIPILKLKNCLLISIQTDLHDLIITALQEDILTEIARTGARGVLIDISALDIVDSFMARTLRDCSVMATLLGAKVIITGIQPAVAITLVDLGLDLSGITTACDIDSGFDMLESMPGVFNSGRIVRRY
ncbi:MAG: STAS domain-containing protein [Methanocalculus sp. MSAO_Arc1]|uniref:STAS domain-containing protein n=1 Tax=Methanocalculus TaxID=71151 RepID=UPI000FF383F5|nr:MULTISPECIES: STAS domain-containing protein [unclassified Methanocalculus]MCP1661454.1 rsbT antagonist protein RsbS [Methanocalculus sp. AMF5]RQD79269.1 MAG: STAS domain-containing protein [Methanocalculus sp. MSAO_Arc1]